MARIFCTKCGIRGDSKCPYCRSIFPGVLDDPLVSAAQEYFEMFLTVERKPDPEFHDTIWGTADENRAEWEKKMKGQRKHYVKFWTFAENEEEAIRKVLHALQTYLKVPGVNLNVAACVHEWALMPGEHSDIDCGHVGADIPVPPDPYQK